MDDTRGGRADAGPWARWVAPAAAPLLGIPVVVVMRHLHVAGHAPVWVCALVLGASVVFQHPQLHLWLTGGDLSRRLILRLALQLGLGVTPWIYAFGWGPLFSVAYLLSGLAHLRWSGARAWRPTAWLALAGVGACQLGIARGWIFTYLGPQLAQFLGWFGIAMIIVVLRQIGLAEEERETAQRAATLKDERFGAMVRNSSDIIAVVGEDGLISYISPAVEPLLGRRPEELVGTDGSVLMSESDFVALVDQLSGLVAEPGGQIRGQFRLLHVDGTFRWHDAVVVNLLDDPAVRGLIINQRDVTEQRLAADQLAYDASHDLLTGLYNRRAFMATFEELLTDSRRSGSGVAVLYLDLDGFKQVNDGLGHEAGDAVLTRVADVLRANVLGSDAVGRLGGDEFAAVLRNVDTVDQAVAATRRVIEALSAPHRIGGRSLPVGASVGIALSQPDVVATALLHRADVAMYEAKRRGVGGWVVYSPEIEARTAAATRAEVLRAIRRGELFLQYQPMVELPSRRAVAVEALVRWRHPERGVLEPSAFMGAAEESGAMIDVGEWALEEACRRVAHWQRLAPGRPPDGHGARLGLCVNFSPRQLEAPGLPGRVGAALASAGLHPEDLMIEVTESALVASPVAHGALDAIAELGVRIAVDDFGTGYTSLQDLGRLPVTTLKLDRSFVAQLDGSPRNAAIPTAVGQLARTLQLTTVAEGVETAAQADELTRMGYRLAQGYLFHPPLDEHDVAAALAAPAPGTAAATAAAAARV